MRPSPLIVRRKRPRLVRRNYSANGDVPDGLRRSIVCLSVWPLARLSVAPLSALWARRVHPLTAFGSFASRLGESSNCYRQRRAWGAKRHSSLNSAGLHRARQQIQTLILI